MPVKHILLSLVALLISIASFAQAPRKITFSDLEKRLQQGEDTLYIVNFWATWCKPCIAELPYFEKAHHAYKADKVKVLLVSMDFPDELEKRVIPFIKKRNLKPEVVLLEDPDPNTWINKVNPQWQGDIPATVFYRKARQQDFKSGELKEEELNSLILKNLK
jgi:thiol-disulfide isomerase/thioredoxin